MGPLDEQIRAAIALQRAGDVASAERELRAVLERSAGMPLASALLGNILSESGRASEAVALLGPIAEREPRRPLVRLNLGMALNRLGRPAEALGHLEAACQIRAGDVQAQFWRGATLERLDRLDEAEAVLGEAIEAAGRDASALGALGERLFRLGRFEESAACYARAIEAGAGGAGMLLRLAMSYQSLRRYDEAMDAAERALRAAPGNPSASLLIADICEKRHELERAAAAAREGLRVSPGHTVLSRILTRLERRMGRAERAEEVSLAALEAGVEDPRLLGPLLIERGHALDALGRYGEAFEAFGRGKAAWLETTRGVFDLESFAAKVRERRGALARVRAGESAGDRSTVFFVGFPRSGTTLMEQVLRAQGGVVSLDEVDLLESAVAGRGRELAGEAGEGEMLAALREGDLGELRRAYWDAAERALGESVGNRVLIDKLPLHITRVAMIRRVFPGARLLVALRDPRDCCLSAFMQYFEANEAMVHFHSVESAARLYAMVMDLWLEAREGIGSPYFEYRYEDLTADFEGTVRGVLEFLGLEWRDEVLRFQEGAKKRAISTPSYERVVSAIDRRAVGRWRKYEGQMGEALEILRPYVEAFGYEG